MHQDWNLSAIDDSFDREWRKPLERDSVAMAGWNRSDKLYSDRHYTGIRTVEIPTRDPHPCSTSCKRCTFHRHPNLLEK